MLRKTHELLIFCLVCQHACAVASNLLSLRFGEERKHYDIAAIAIFNIVSYGIGETNEEELAECVLDIQISIARFGKVLGLCSEAAECVYVAKISVCEVVSDAEYLDIDDCAVKKVFFANVAKMSLASADAREAVTRARDSADFVSEEGFLGLLRGMMNAFGKEVSVSNGVATICDIHDNYAEQGSVTELSFIDEVRILGSHSDVLERKDTWSVLVWLFDRMKIAELTLHGCNLSASNVQDIAKLRLRKLSASTCVLRGLASIGDSYSALMTTLRILVISHRSAEETKLGVAEMAAIARISLRELYLPAARLEAGSLGALVRLGSALVQTLRILDVSDNELSVEDVEAILELRVEELIAKRCFSVPGRIALFGRFSTLQQALRTFDVSANVLSERDLYVMSYLCVKHLAMLSCNTRPGILYQIVGTRDSPLRNTLETIEIEYASLCMADKRALGHIKGLQIVEHEEYAQAAPRCPKRHACPFWA